MFVCIQGCHAPGSPALFRVAAEGLEKGLANHFTFWHCDMAPVYIHVHTHTHTKGLANHFIFWHCDMALVYTHTHTHTHTHTYVCTYTKYACII